MCIVADVNDPPSVVGEQLRSLLGLHNVGYIDSDAVASLPGELGDDGADNDSCCCCCCCCSICANAIDGIVGVGVGVGVAAAAAVVAGPFPSLFLCELA